MLNERGYERFAATTLDRVNCTLAATETFNERNGNATLDEAVTRVQAIVAAASEAGHDHASRARSAARSRARSTPARSPRCASGSTAPTSWCSRTRSASRPRQRVRRLVERVSILGPRVGAHLHNTRNTGYASAWAALDGGASVLDASIGGLGGCPFSPNATGNVATEDLVWQLERDGVRTGIDVAALVDVSLWLEEVLERPLEGYLYRAARWP